ncbi:hypothetical protein [Delftia sp. HK171]|uniref:hypothetical protein n=1 Tax=Delftia sp. HK171 TaxID=1920191 RepID=UPI001153A025|nr:hypothetical protein [Delftia sp. HK171]TQL83095.1 hypothetical protein FB549_0582 [Delftia sp. HK171]
MSEAPTTQERYAAATHSSNLRSSADTVGDADYLIAAGLCKARFGALLMRLQSEWDASACRIPSRPTRRDIARAAQKSLGKGITKVTKESSDAARQRLEATYSSEKAMLSQRLRSLSAVRRHLAIKLLLDDLPDESVTDIVLRWLDPACPVCQGRGKQLQKWSETELSGDACGCCSGSGKKPEGNDTERLALSYMSACVGDARHGIKQKTAGRH